MKLFVFVKNFLHHKTFKKCSENPFIFVRFILLGIPISITYESNSIIMHGAIQRSVIFDMSQTLLETFCRCQILNYVFDDLGMHKMAKFQIHKYNAYFSPDKFE